jgi:hypothetical protein
VVCCALICSGCNGFDALCVSWDHTALSTSSVCLRSMSLPADLPQLCCLRYLAVCVCQSQRLATRPKATTTDV